MTKNKLTICLVALNCLFVFIFSNSFVSAQTVNSYGALKIEQSQSGVITLAPGKAMTVWVKFKNKGKTAWTNSGSKVVAIKDTGVAAKQSQFRHIFWKGPFVAANLSEKEVKPGQTGTFRFAIQAPSKTGSYAAKFQLYTGSSVISGSSLELSVKVADRQIAAVTTKPSSALPPTTYNLPPTTSDLNLKEPLIRIGLYKTSAPVKIAANSGYEIRDKNNNLILAQANGEESEAVFDFNLQKYFLNVGGRRILTTDSYLKFIPQSGSILKITSYENRPAWNPSLNDNEFRGNVEVRYNSKNKELWVIDELPMEDYLRGMAEAHNDSPLEHLKAMSIAERTYAFYYYLHPTKHADQDFLLTPTAYDQVYRGYGTEKRLNNVVTAATATRGMVITYNNEIVNTPYFTQSNGRTKAWSEVWSGEKPYLVSKPDPDCESMTLLGHGVGLSAAGAKARAQRGAKYDEILKYYYTGIDIKKAY